MFNIRPKRSYICIIQQNQRCCVPSGKLFITYADLDLRYVTLTLSECMVKCRIIPRNVAAGYRYQ
jgi:hypothetical protein